MVQIDDDVFIDMLWERVSTFAPNVYTDEFWGEVFEELKDGGWLKEPRYNNPSYIVDNIAINGNIHPIEECPELYPEIDESYGGDVEAWAEDKGYGIVEGYVVVNLGI